MKVFLSWSGKDSQAAALALHAWLPTVVHTVKPYMSAENIDKGERWSLDIAKQLEDTNFGIIFMTPENLVAPWILFEAGALSKSIEKSRVSPLLFELSPSDLAKSPLLQFQLTQFKKDDFRKLLHSMNNASPDAEKLPLDVLNKSFDRAWAELDEEIKKIQFSKGSSAPPQVGANPKTDKVDEILEELLTIARTQIKIMRSPEDILPVGYLREVLSLERAISNMPATMDGPFREELLEGFQYIERAGKYILDRMGFSKNQEWSGRGDDQDGFLGAPPSRRASAMERARRQREQAAESASEIVDPSIASRDG
jgi:TIR domain